MPQGPPPSSFEMQPRGTEQVAGPGQGASRCWAPVTLAAVQPAASVQAAGGPVDRSAEGDGDQTLTYGEGAETGGRGRWEARRGGAGFSGRFRLPREDIESGQGRETLARCVQGQSNPPTHGPPRGHCPLHLLSHGALTTHRSGGAAWQPGQLPEAARGRPGLPILTRSLSGPRPCRSQLGSVLPPTHTPEPEGARGGSPREGALSLRSCAPGARPTARRRAPHR